MPDIRYVCLSDTHFGEEDSLLTNLKTASTDTDPSQPSPVMRQLVDCLRYLISENKNKKKPTLILNGDILELALSTTNEAAMVFERFIELVMPKDNQLFERIIYIPGNHDHHLWEIARETQYTDHIGGLDPSEYLPIPYHTTSMFVENTPKPVPSYFLTRLVRRYPHLKDFVITVAYPNLGLIHEKDQRCVIFSHGHFIESLYQLMSTMKNLLFPERKKPVHIWDIEAENFAWIDFFWSTMGRSGEVGTEVELFYEKMQDKENFKRLLYNTAEGLAKKYDLPGWGDMMEAKILKWIFGQMVDKMTGIERRQTDRPLSQEAERGLWEYMNGPVKDQILIERKGNMPREVTFVFGHTHKPFQEDMNFSGFPRWVDVYNTGGWIVESVAPEPLHGGAVILVDEKLNTISLNMYNEAEDPSKYEVRVKEATHEGEERNPFFRRINNLVKPSEDPWKTFSAIASRTVRIRAQNLRARINERR
ncbi:MAG: metallophosphoesterase [Deltaproteobacteria bacterium]|nr:metallophosphoesterase [Deltaproteobacteria bacterium]